MKHPLAVQTMTWGDAQHDAFAAIFARCRAAGFSAVEIGMARLGKRPAYAVGELLRESGLRLAASHTGTRIFAPGQAGGQWEQLDAVLDLVIRLRADRLCCSGFPDEGRAALEAEVASMADAAHRCADRGVRLCYHNHSWEFQPHHPVYDRLWDIEPLGYCLDLGWLVRAGQDIPTWLERLDDRIEVLHFKDLATADGADTIHLGTGVVPLHTAADWLRRRRRPCWLTAEQDRAADADAAAERNGRWLRDFAEGADP